MSKFNIYRAKNSNSHSSMNDYKSIIAAEIFWTAGGKQGSRNEIRAVTPNSIDETYEASNGDLVGAIELNEASITEWISTHKEIVAAIDTIQEVHNDAFFRCKEAIETINKHSNVLSEYDGFYEKIYDYKVPVRRPWIPMEMEYRSVLINRYRAN